MDFRVGKIVRRQPRKLEIIKMSKFESCKAVEMNKKAWQKVFDQIEHEIQHPKPEDLSREFATVIPERIFENVCEIIQLPSDVSVKEDEVKIEPEPESMIRKEPKIDRVHSIVIERERDSDTDVEVSDDIKKPTRNRYYHFLKMPLRQMLRWNTKLLGPEREDEKGIIRKANDLTDRIAQEFCTYMQELGGEHHSKLFIPNVIKELFQVEFNTHAAQSLQIIPRELCTIPTAVAQYSNNRSLSYRYILDRMLTLDLKAEKSQLNYKAFDRSLPIKDVWVPPFNNIHDQWYTEKMLPQNIVTMKAVWEGIEHLRCVKEYCKWMIDHPEIPRPPYLEQLGYFDSKTLNAACSKETLQTELPGPTVIPESATHDENPADDMNEIKRRMTLLTEFQTK